MRHLFRLLASLCRTALALTLLACERGDHVRATEAMAQGPSRPLPQEQAWQFVSVTSAPAEPRTDSVRLAFAAAVMPLAEQWLGQPDLSRRYCLSYGRLGKLVEPPKGLATGLTAGRRTVVPVSACEMPDNTLMVRERRSGRPALFLYVNAPRIEGDSAFGNAGFHAEVLAGAEWTCAAARRNGHWRVVRCELWGAS